MADDVVPYPGSVAPGSRGVSVRRLKRALQAAGYTTGTTDVYDPKTRMAVRLFQAQHSDVGERPLAVDGRVGPVTWAALLGARRFATADSPPIALAALGRAIAEIGTMEEPPGSNRGPRVDEYLGAVGIVPSEGGQPWCAAFVYWCFLRAAAAEGVPNPAIRSASVHRQWQKTGEMGTLRVTRSEAQEDPSRVVPGCVFVIATGAQTGHMGFVEAVVGGHLRTIEGNTNPGGSRDGYGVFRRQGRRITDVNRGFIVYGS